MKKLLVLLCAVLTTATISAQFGGSGSGTQNDPYLIFNPIHLDQMRNFLGKTGVYFKLMADIDLEEYIADNYPTQGWLPIGNSSSVFRGNLDGNGKKITNLTINGTSNCFLQFRKGFVHPLGISHHLTVKSPVISHIIRILVSLHLPFTY